MASDTVLGFAAQQGFSRMEDINDVLESILNGGTDPINLPLTFLMYITKNFSEDQKIGNGGFGEVYKGTLKNRTVAVKRLFSDKTIREESFYREVDNLMAVKHQNIVQFLGFCANTENIPMEDPYSQDCVKYIYAEKRERLLCFEYMSNGNLHSHLTDELRGLEWHTRYKIIKNICEGLRYLHEEKRMIHRDLKPGNVLLDDSMAPKIADFGISKFLDDGASKAVTTNIQMSQGYCAPEFMKHYEVSFKSDIYSLGVIIIELVTGRKEHPDIKNIFKRWRYRWSKAKETTMRYQQVAKCIELGLQCIKEDPNKRPSISKIIKDLNEMDSENWQVNNPLEPTIGQIIPNWNELLVVDPLELHLSIEPNKQIACSLQLINETDAYIAFNIEMMSPLLFCIQPKRSIVPPLSKCAVIITLQAQKNVRKHMEHANKLTVRSTKVDGSLTYEDITEDMFNKYAVEVVDEVSLTVIYDAPPLLEESEAGHDTENLNCAETPNEPTGAVCKMCSLASNELIRVYPLKYVFPFEQEKVQFSQTIFNVTDDYVAFKLKTRYATGRYTSSTYKGILSPRSSLVIDKTRVSPKSITGWGFELLRVLSTTVTKGFKTSDITDNLFKTSGRLVPEVEVPVFIATRPGPRSWEVMTSDIPSASPTDKQVDLNANGINPQITSSALHELIQVDPLEFIFPLESKEVVFFMKIINITDEYVAFLVRYTQDETDRGLYQTRPKEGILSPRSMLLLNNTWDSPEDAQAAMQGKNFIYVDSAIVSKDFKTSDITTDLFDEPAAGRLVHEVKLPVFLVAPSGPPQSCEVIPPPSPMNGPDVQKEHDKLQLSTDNRQVDINSQMTTWQPSKNEYGLTWVISIDVHPTEPWIMTTQHDRYIRIWNYHMQQVKRFFLGPSQVTSAKFIARKQWIVAGTTNGFIYVYSYDPLKRIRVVMVHSGSVDSLAMHATEPYILSASFGGEIQLRCCEHLELLQRFSATILCAGCIAFDPSGATFASTCGDSIKIRNLDSGDCKLVLRGHSCVVTCLEYFTTRKGELYLISGSQDKTAKIWDCQTGRCVRTLQVHSPVRTVCFHPDIPVLITGSYDGSIRLWNSTSFRRERILKFGLKSLNAISCLKESTRIVIGHASGLALAEIGPQQLSAS